MKTSSAIIKLVLRTNKVLSDGSHPIMLRCQFNGRKEISTGCSCTVKYWDERTESVKRGYPNYATINELIHRLKSEAIDIRNKYEVEGKAYTPAMVLQQKVATVATDGDLKVLIGRYTAHLSPTTKKTWKAFQNSFFGFIGRDITIQELDLETIKAYAQHLEDKGLKSGSILMFVTKLSAICKFAIEEGIIKDNPFKRWNFCKKYKADANLLYVDRQCIDVLKEMLLEQLITMTGKETFRYNDDGLEKFLDRKSDLFCLAFYLIGFTAFGAAPIDLAQLKIQDMNVEVVNNVNYYCWSIKRQKTGVPIKIMISQNKFFDCVVFRTLIMFRKGYLLPVLDGVVNDHLKIYKKVSNWLSNHTSVLQNWFRKANERIVKMNIENNTNIPLIPTECTFYSYRSSFAMAFLQNGGNLIQLCSMLGRGVNASLKAYVKLLKQSQDIADAVSLMG